MSLSSIVRRFACLVLAAAMLSVLSGCAGRGGEEMAPVPTLAPAGVRFSAPDGDRVVRQAGDYLLYLPMADELRLITQSIHLQEANLNDTVRTLVESLLEAENAIRAAAGDASRALALYQDRAPEISGGICTVNLDPAALRLDYSDYYKLCVALSTTLCALDEIQWTNVLTAGRSVALDITGSLAMGTLTAHPGENLPVLWEQMEAKRTPLGADMSSTPLSAQTTIYYPLTEGRGIGCESRLLNYPGQTAGQLATTLADEITQTVRARAGDPSMPSLRDYLLHDPLSSDLEEGGRLITLSFRENVDEMLEKWDTDFPCLVSAVVCTLTTFVPGVSAVSVRIGDTPVTELSNERYRSGLLLGGLVQRSSVAGFLAGSAVIFLEKEGRLVRCEKPLEQQASDSPRALLRALMAGPDRKEIASGITGTLPQDISEEDVLGIAAEGDVLLVNLSETFRDAIRQEGPEREAILCYSMVNTLCLNSGLRRVCFFFEGGQAESIAGELYWAGEFMYNPSL